MARPKKATVDYFPHVTEHGKTMFVLESRWGNDGYAAWFKILERLGASDNHFIDCRDLGTWAYLVAYTKVSSETLNAILDLLADLNAIEPDFWREKLIYSENFVTGVTDAYRKRINSLPTREKVIAAANVSLKEFPAEETPLNEQSSAGSTEREREREREREIKPPPTPSKMPAHEITKLYQDYSGRLMVGGGDRVVLQDICRDFTPERIREAFQEAAAAKPTHFLPYLLSILKNREPPIEPPPEDSDFMKEHRRLYGS